MKTIATHGALAAALVPFLALQSGLSGLAVRAADGHLVYALDDSDIQMAIGKNLAAHGVWGITRYEFSGAGSSLAWPMLLAAVNRAVWLDDRTPFALNIVSALALPVLCDVVLRRYVTSRAGRAAARAGSTSYSDCARSSASPSVPSERMARHRSVPTLSSPK